MQGRDPAGRTRLGKNALDDLRSKANVRRWVEQRFQLFGSDCALDLRILHENLPKRDPLRDTLHCEVIDQLMRRLLSKLFGEREHDPLGQQEAPKNIEIAAHLAGVDLKIRQ